MTRVSEKDAPDRATEGLLPFYGRVPDVMMVDKTKAQLFASLGRERGLFKGIADWPSLGEALARRSRDYLERHGEEAWEAAGGAYGDDGEPTCSPTSEVAGGLVREIAASAGGLFWTDAQGEEWAVRLAPAGQDRDTLYGFAFNWSGPRPEERAHALRLAGRAEQALWLVHMEVLRQRRSVVLLPDVLLGQAVWGGARKDWPQDWRRDLWPTLRSLTSLKLEVLRLSEDGWRPRFGLCSVAVASVEALWVTRPGDNRCRAECPMWGSGRRHRHYLVEAGAGFLGALERFAVGDGLGGRGYDFTRSLEGDAKEEWRRATRAGQIINVSVPTALFAGAKWAGLSRPAARVIHALVGEVTRPGNGRSGRTDRADVLRGNVVPGPTAESRVACPLLDPRGRHVAFGGNGRRPGMGYRLVGGGRGWLYKCGFPVPKDAAGLARAVRGFLKALDEVSVGLGLTAAGFEPDDGVWLDLSQMRVLARSRAGVGQLLSYHLRIYGPEDYLQRCRDLFARQGNFPAIPGGDAERSEADRPSENLSTRLRLTGLKQKEIAARLGVTQSFVSQVLNEDRRLPPRLRPAVEGLLEAVATSSR